MSNCYTTQAYAELYNRLTEEQIRNGGLEREARTLTDESGKRQVNLSNDELEEFEQTEYCAYWLSEHDEIGDAEMDKLIEWLDEEDLFEPQTCRACGTALTLDEDDHQNQKCRSHVGRGEAEFPVNPIGTHEPSLSPEENRRQDIIELAREEHCSNYYSDNEYPTIDDDAKVSEGDDNGAYVQAWVWVSFEGTPLDKEALQSKPDITA
jgi:hypothetical protein